MIIFPKMNRDPTNHLLSSINMHRSFSSNQMIRSQLIAVVVLFAVLAQSHAWAQDVTADISEHAKQYTNLEKDITTSKARILSSTETFAAQKDAYEQLSYVGGELSTLDREFSVLTMSILLARLVTDKRFITRAWRYVELQRDYMVKRASSLADFIEKAMGYKTDPETARFLLAARDLCRSSVDFLHGLQLKGPKK